MTSIPPRAAAARRWAGLVALAMLTGCTSGGPDGPSSTTPTTPTTPAGCTVSAVTITGSTVGLVVGGTASLTATLTQTGCSTVVVVWTSSDTSVAVVSQAGVVTAVTAGGPVTITALAGTVSGTVQVSATFATITNDLRYAFAWAYAPSLASYTSISGYEYSSNGAGVVFARSGVGVYTTTFAGLGRQAGQADNVQVVAYGASGSRCKLAGWTATGADMVADVRCFDTAGAPVDATYDVFVTGASSLQGGYAFALTPSATAASSFAAARTAYTANRTPVAITRSATGQYVVTFAGLNPTDGSAFNFQVTAFGAGTEYCMLSNWGTTTTDVQLGVRCYAPSGAPADSRFSVVMLNRGRLGARTGFIWADQEAFDLNIAYAGKAAYTYASTGTFGASVKRTATGTYVVTWPGMFRGPATDRETVLVTGHGATGTGPFVFSPISCQVGGWQSAIFSVTIYCRDANGALADSKFEVALIGN